MDQTGKDTMTAAIRSFHLPRYEEIPNVGLYLEQTTKYISEYLAPLGDVTITASMVSNYVKMGLVASPVKKRYSREQIAYLTFIAVIKTVLSMEDIRLFLALQKRTYDCPTAYEYFRVELENVLQYVFGIKDEVDNVGVDSTDEKILLRNAIITVAHKVYVDRCFAELRRMEQNRADG